jgi:hypothetical protein
MFPSNFLTSLAIFILSGFTLIYRISRTQQQSHWHRKVLVHFLLLVVMFACGVTAGSSGKAIHTFCRSMPAVQDLVI